MIKPALSIFVSYSSADKEVANRIARSLQRRAVNVWIDDIQIIPGDVLLERINAGINQAHVLVLIVSRKSLESDWVRYEWTTYVHKKISKGEDLYLVPFLIEELELPPELSRYRYIEAKGDYRSAFSELAVSVERIAVNLANKARGYQTLVGEHSDRLLDQNSTQITQKSTMLPVGRPFSKYEFHHWQDTPGTLNLVRAKLYDSMTGEVLPCNTQVLQHDDHNFVVRCSLLVPHNESVTFLGELQAENYLSRFVSEGAEYTEFVVRFPIDLFKYTLITPNTDDYKKIIVRSQHRNAKILPRIIRGGEIFHEFKARNVRFGDDIRFNIENQSGYSTK